MNKSFLLRTVLGVVIAIGGGAIAGCDMLNHDEEYADVVSVTPVTEQVRIPREECRDEVVSQQTPIKQRVCKMIYDVRERTIGYDVRYRIGDDEPVQVRLDHDPGSRIPVRDGFLVLG
jgi:uncharacterized protein YcfJ